MYGLAETFFWLLLLVMAIRYFVWRGRWQDLQAAVRRGNQEIAALKARLDEFEGAEGPRPWGPVAETVPAPAAAAPVPTVREPAPPPAIVPVPLASEHLPDLSALADRLEAEAKPPESLPPAEDMAAAEAPEAPAEAAPPVWARRPAGIAPRPPARAPLADAFARLRGNPDLEAIIGTSWLNKIGVAVLVIGIALLSGYSLQYLGPAGKIGLGAAISLLLLGAGVWLERQHRYMLFARPLIGGGWALLYFTAYAAGAIPASRILAEPWMALGVLLAVAAGMIVHSLRYRNEIVTGMAYLLGFLAILIGSMEPTSLLASGLLAASFVVIFRFIPWYRLSAGMVIATWFTVWFWLTHNAHPEPPTPPTFWTLELILVAYWAIFALADYLRVPQGGEQSWLQRLSVAVNSLAFAVLSFLMYVATFPAATLHGFFGVVALGALAAAAIALWRGRDFSRVFHVVLAGANIAAAVPFAVAAWNWPSPWIVLGWTALAVLMIGLGLWRRQLAYRVEGYLVGALAAALAFAWAAAPSSLFGSASALELAGWRWPTVIVVAAALYGGELALLWFRERVHPLESALGTVAGYAATALLAILVWRDVDIRALGLVWLAGALVSFEFGLRVEQLHMRIRGYLLAVAALLTILGFAVAPQIGLPFVLRGLPSLQAAEGLEPWVGINLACGAAAFLWLAFRLHHGGKRLRPAETGSAPLAAHVSAALMALLVWVELPPAAVTLAGAALAVAYRQAGAHWKLPPLRQEAFAFILFAWVRMFLFDFVADGDLLGISTRLWTGLTLAAVLYYFRHTTEALADDTPWGEVERRLPVSFSFMAIAGLLVMVWLEVEPSLQVLVWTLFATALLLAGIRFRLGDYRLQAYLLMAAGLAHLFAIDLPEPQLVYGISSRLVCGLPLAALLYACRVLAGRPGEAGPLAELERHVPVAASFAGALTLAGLVWFELGESVAVIGWSVLALALFSAGVLRAQTDYRAQAYLLGLVAFLQSLNAEFGLGGASGSALVTAAAIVTLLALALLWRRRRAELGAAMLPVLALAERWATPVFVVLSALLGMALIWSRVDGNLTTISWSVEALAAIGLGFAVKERSLRLSGLGLLAVCLGKGLVFDLSGADAIVRIVSFIGLGAILVAISFVYTRYRHVLKSYI